jgi:hypothetical protein
MTIETLKDENPALFDPKGVANQRLIKTSLTPAARLPQCLHRS